MSLFWLQSQASTTTIGGAVGGGSSPTQADTYADAVLDLAPVAYYKMGESTGTTMADSSTTGNAGTYQGSPTLGATGPFTGATGVTFDGSTNWAQAGYSSALDFGTADFSLLAWIKGADPFVGECIMARDDLNDRDGWSFYTWYDALRSKFMDASWNEVVAESASTTDLDDDAWHMVGITADRDGNAQFYLDGSAYGGTTDISSYAYSLSASKSLYIARASSGSYLAGSVCQVAAFDSLLSSGDFSDLWTAAGN